MFVLDVVDNGSSALVTQFSWWGRRVIVIGKNSVLTYPYSSCMVSGVVNVPWFARPSAAPK